MSVIDGETIRFVGGYYERKGSEITKYYMAGAARVAMRKYTIPQSMTVEYMLGDHLGSTSVTTDSNGAMISEMRYKPWGELRYTWTDAPASTSPAYELTRYQYTGQYSYDVEFGLKYYGARFYDSAVGRFVSADTVIPSGAQGLDRYAYTNNNPINYTDPSGHDSIVAITSTQWNAYSSYLTSELLPWGRNIATAEKWGGGIFGVIGAVAGEALCGPYCAAVGGSAGAAVGVELADGASGKKTYAELQDIQVEIDRITDLMVAESEDSGKPAGGLTIVLDENIASEDGFATDITYHITIIGPNGQTTTMEIYGGTYDYLIEMFSTYEVPGAIVTEDVDANFSYEEEDE